MIKVQTDGHGNFWPHKLLQAFYDLNNMYLPPLCIKKGGQEEYCTTQTEKLTSRVVIFLPKNPVLRWNILREPTDGFPANKFLFAGTVPAHKF